MRPPVPAPARHPAPRPRPAGLAFALVSWLACLCSLACGGEPLDRTAFQVPAGARDTPREPCAQREPRRVALFGDLHVHTALSSDAWNYDVEVRPRDAYGYAFGEPVRLPPNDAHGRGTREVRIDRPLDFAAVTDHAEFLGEQLLCTDPESEVYETEVCRAIRASTAPTDSPLGFKIMHPAPSREAEVCGEDGARCAEASVAGWQETIAAAEEWNDTSSACARTTFIAYEYSSHRLGSNLHRNVIFRSRVVPARPASYVDLQREWELWELLRDSCNESGTGCQVLAIPHNSNISNGRMFAVDYPGADGIEAQAARARLRQSLEPVVEVMQHKGDSECRRGLPGILGSDDPLCDFEKFENMAFGRFGDGDPDACWDWPLADWTPHLGPDCISHRSYVRTALVEGLAEEARLGVNPFKFGLMASTDTHNGTAGAVQERGWAGHLGVADADLQRRLAAEPGVMGNVANGPGGLVGVWAEENSREAVFDAIRRREVFGTSGPRIRPRFFGAWSLPAELCEDPEMLRHADDAGVPMGADLPRPADASQAPHFAVWAARDPGTAATPGGLLQRLQVIKGWVDDEGGLHQQVVDVAGGENGASVDRESCTPEGPGADFLCAVWRDPDFDAGRRAVYYARVVENPSCRYSTWDCLGLPEDQRPSGCTEPIMQEVQQERAWTSPIWYTPAP